MKINKSSVILTVFLLIFFILSIFKDEGGIVVVTTDKIYRAKVELPYLIKFAAIIEREGYYRTWVNEIIAPKANNDEERIEHIFNWIKGLPSEEIINKLGDVNQHEYYVLVKQYGHIYEKLGVFCNLMAIAGYPASSIYGHEQGKVIVRIPKPEKFLYFDFISGKRNPKEILKRYPQDKEKCEIELRKLSSPINKLIRRKYLWGDLSLSRYRFFYYFQKPLKPEHIKALLK